MKKNKRERVNHVYFALFPIIILLDQAVKARVHSAMEPGQSIPVIRNIFHLSYVQNTGAAFSFMKGHTGLITIFTGILLAAILVYLLVWARDKSGFFTCSLLLIAGGGVGNLIDRVARGYVVDMFDFRFWPVFNVADVAICVGCVMLVVYLLILDRVN